MRLSLLAAFVAALIPTQPLLAWGKTGHRVGAQIAEQHLNRCARSAVRQILGHEDLAEASTWADEMRSSKDPFWQTTANPYHYVTVPDGRGYAEIGPPPEGDAAAALAHFAAVVRDRSLTLESRQLALRFIIHLVGDLHQPLHVGKGDDRGGNDVKVTFFGEPTNLHAVWDSALIDQQQLSYSEYAARLERRIGRRQKEAWTTADPSVWIAESQTLRSWAYPAGSALSYDYVFDQMPYVELRLAQSGIRLAAYLNALFTNKGGQCVPPGAARPAWAAAPREARR